MSSTYMKMATQDDEKKAELFERCMTAVNDLDICETDAAMVFADLQIAMVSALVLTHDIKRKPNEEIASNANALLIDAIANFLAKVACSDDSDDD